MTTVQIPPTAAEDRSTPQSLVLHVLCPSLPPPNRFTLNNLPLYTTVADIKVRLSQSIASHPTADSQRLFYLGKPLSNDHATLRSLLEPMNGSEFSMHLVLPPSSPSQAPTTDDGSYQNNLRINQPLNTRQPEQQLRQRYSPVNSSSTSDVAARALHEDARRRLIEHRQRSEAASSTESAQTHASNWPPLYRDTYIGRRLPRPPSFIPGPSSPGPPTTAPFAAASNLSSLDTGNGLHLPEEVQPRLRLLKQYINLAEEQLECGIVPPISHINQLRTQLFRLLGDQQRLPLPERGEYIEPLLTRIFDISTRADLLRLGQSGSQASHAGSTSGALAPLYLLSSPSGYQAIVATSVAGDVVRALGTAQTPQTTSALGGQPPAMQPNVNPAIMENVVRQAVLNQQPVADGQLGLGRNLRRLWLFMRLYFFCYMFSQPGTWRRIIYVALAVIASILSETDAPQRIYQMVFAPVQRHLEGLVRFTPEEHVAAGPQRGETSADEATMNQQPGLQNGREANWAAGLHHSLRRVERSVALFIASLVPGVGERHIEVRNAAEAAHNAELTRQEEERRRREEEEEEAAAETEENLPETDDAAAHQQSGQATTENESLNEPHSVIPQEHAP